MGDVIEQDFGKKHREQAKMLARLLDMCEEREQEILKNPLPALSEASRRVCQYRSLLVEIDNALNPMPVFSPLGDTTWTTQTLRTVMVTGEEYDAIQKIKAILSETRLL